MASCSGWPKAAQKMGCQGWEAVVPVYRTWLLFHELYGSGRRMLRLLLPVYNVYILFRCGADLALAFNRSAWFGLGLTLLPFSCSGWPKAAHSRPSEGRPPCGSAGRAARSNR